MGLFDDYFDPEQFEGGGLLGRLLSLQQQQGQYQPLQRFDAPSGQPVTGASPQQFPSAASSTPAASAPQAPGSNAYIPIGDYLMPQFGGVGMPQPGSLPDLGDRLSAGFQSWAHTPLGSPFAALANGITGFNSGQTVNQATPRNSLPRDDAPPQQSPPFAPSAPQAVAGSSQRTLVGRVVRRPNSTSFGRSFRYGG